MITDSGVLYIEPSARTSNEPLVDNLTRKMTAAFRQSSVGTCYRGFHICACGVASSSCDHILPGGEQTNSLCIHYLAYHRNEVPQAQLDKVAALTSGEAEPTHDELKPPASTQFYKGNQYTTR